MNNEKIPYNTMTLEQLREEFIFTLEDYTLPTELLYEAHKRLWSWILKHANEFPSKREWPGWDTGLAHYGLSAYFGGHEILNRCFLCMRHPTCTGCPLKAVHEALSTCSPASCELYHAWAHARRTKDSERFRELTTLILNAPNWLSRDTPPSDSAYCGE